VTRFGKPIADVVPAAPLASAAEWLGMMADTVHILGDIVSPVINESDLDPEERLELFDRGTKRQRQREIAFSKKAKRDHGWTREDIYRRGRSD
jgi:hypothetical protein